MGIRDLERSMGDVPEHSRPNLRRQLGVTLDFPILMLPEGHRKVVRAYGGRMIVDGFVSYYSSRIVRERSPK